MAVVAELPRAVTTGFTSTSGMLRQRRSILGRRRFSGRRSSAIRCSLSAWLELQFKSNTLLPERLWLGPASLSRNRRPIRFGKILALVPLLYLYLHFFFFLVQLVFHLYWRSVWWCSEYSLKRFKFENFIWWELDSFQNSYFEVSPLSCSSFTIVKEWILTNLSITKWLIEAD